MAKPPIVGALALQGGYASHIAVLSSLGADAREIRTVTELAACDALVIPGGESTTLTRLLMTPGTGYGTDRPWEPSPLWHAIRDFAHDKPVMGTCAGLILLGRSDGDERVVPFEAIPVTVARNAYGRQTESFITRIPVDIPNGDDRERGPYPATFIRAPKIVKLDPGVEVIARAPGANGATDPVMVRAGNLLGLSFHPELTPEDRRIHRYFLSLIK